MRHRFDWQHLSLALCALSLVGCSCGGSEEVVTGGETESVDPVVVGGLAMGTVEGVIRLAADSALPRYAANPMIAPEETPIPPDCTPMSDSDAEPLVMSDDRGLSLVPVVGLGDAEHWPSRGAPRTVEVHIRNCRLDPTVITATAGDVLQVHNDLLYPFFPTLGAGGFMQAVLPGEAREFELDSPRPVTLQCGVTSPCGRTEVLVLGSPVHTLSAEGGHFTLSVPAGQDVELVAWHPLLAEASVHVTVAPGGTEHVEIEVHVPATAPAPPPSTLPDGELPEDHPELGPF